MTAQALSNCRFAQAGSGYNHEQVTLREPKKMAPEKLVSGGLAPGSDSSDCRPPLSRVFLLSPANTSAIRGQLLLNGNSEFELAQRIRREGAPLGELFSFISSLYFRGKLAYAEAFSHLPTGFQIVLLGSIASDKYAEPLLEIFGARLMFPQQFVGRGDMSRGGLMLR